MKIKELKIYTPNLSEQSTFYAKTLGLKISRQSSDSISFNIGDSILSFEYRKKITPYHFAINIPSNQEKEALEWLKKRVEIIINENIEIHDFDFWNAKAIYFYDKDKNIVEFIARKNLTNQSTIGFNQRSLLEISEIGLPTNDIQNEFDILNQGANFNIYSGNLKRFCAIGDENGLIICINKKLKDYWFPTKDKPYSSDFTIYIEKNENELRIEYQNEKLRIVNTK